MPQSGKKHLRVRKVKKPFDYSVLKPTDLRNKGPGDWTLPGYNYCGPGNPLDGRPPMNPTDAVCMEHDKDEEYDYYMWQPGDDTIIDRLTDLEETHLATSLASVFFTGKKAAYKAGLIGERSPPQKKALDMGASPDKKAVISKFAMKGRDLNQDVDMQAVPAPDSTAVATRGAGGPGSAGPGHNDETPLDPFKNPRMHIFPKTLNMVHRGISSRLSTGMNRQANIGPPTSVNTISYRLSCPLDYQITFQQINDTSIPAIPTTPEYLIGYNQVKGVYRYYHVFACKYKFRFWIEQNSDEEFEIYAYMHGKQFPPALDYASSGNMPVRKAYRLMHPNCRFIGNLYGQNAHRDSTTRMFKNQIEFEINYNHHMDLNEISEDVEVETWTKVGEAPKLGEFLTLMIQRSERSPNGPNDDTATVQVRAANASPSAPGVQIPEVRPYTNIQGSGATTTVFYDYVVEMAVQYKDRGYNFEYIEHNTGVDLSGMYAQRNTTNT